MMMLTAEVVIRLSCQDRQGTTQVVEVPIGPDQVPLVWLAAHGSAHSSPEEMERLHAGEPAIAPRSNPALWGAAVALLAAEKRLRELCS